MQEDDTKQWVLKAPLLLAIILLVMLLLTSFLLSGRTLSPAQPKTEQLKSESGTSYANGYSDGIFLVDIFDYRAYSSCRDEIVGFIEGKFV